VSIHLQAQLHSISGSAWSLLLLALFGHADMSA
jgi:hypothetical protein